jgi:hypothetical protein
MAGMKHPIKIRKKPPRGVSRRERYALFIPIIPVPAASVNIEGMVTGGEVVQLACGADNLLDPRITEFDHIARIHIDQVIMLHAVIGFLKLCDVLSELVFYHQVTIEQQFNGVIEGGPADPVVLILHEDV